MMTIITLHVGLSILVGLSSYVAGRRGDFFLFFILSLIITPLFAMFVLLIGTPRVVDSEGNKAKAGQAL
ncbi:hypothetical protein [Pseudopelagicola sp. nBUS_19]|uniref:hypothetical protein n=1 Tax=Pseudopelagicola sp. nBUS_19 TaxID=3395316 RepID=UPI003EBD4580